jgi:hypothetical protein
VFPDWRLLREYSASVADAPLRPWERARCRAYVGLWVLKYWPKLARDVVFAGERLITRRRGGASTGGGASTAEQAPDPDAEHASAADHAA